MLNKEKINQLAELTKLELTDNELELYKLELEKILIELEKIKNLNIKEKTEPLISPSDNQNCYTNINNQHLTKEEIFKNAALTDDEYIIVPKVIE